MRRQIKTLIRADIAAMLKGNVRQMCANVTST